MNKYLIDHQDLLSRLLTQYSVLWLRRGFWYVLEACLPARSDLSTVNGKYFSLLFIIHIYIHCTYRYIYESLRVGASKESRCPRESECNSAADHIPEGYPFLLYINLHNPDELFYLRRHSARYEVPTYYGKMVTFRAVSKLNAISHVIKYFIHHCFGTVPTYLHTIHTYIYTYCMYLCALLRCRLLRYHYDIHFNSG